jgi:hypothetical protein
MAAVVMTEGQATKLVSRVEEQVREEKRLVEEIAELRTREAEAVEAALREGKPTRGPSTKAEPLRRKREAAERKLTDIREFELPAAHQLAVEAQEALRAAKLEHARTEARIFDQFEAEAIPRIAAGFEEILRAYAALAEAAAGREEVYAEIESDGLLNGLNENEVELIRRDFRSPLMSQFPVSPAALFEVLTEAVLDPHAGDLQYEATFAQEHPAAAAFVSLLEEAREERLYRRVRLRFTEPRSAAADFNSRTNDRAGGMAGSGFFS